MRKINVKRVLTATLTGMVTLSLSTCGEQGGGSPAESASTIAVPAEMKAEAESAAESQDSGKNGKEATGDADRPEAMSQEDREAIQKESAFGTTLGYLFNGGAYVSAIYLTEVPGYYRGYGINAEYIEGRSVAIMVGTGRCLWGTDHVAAILVLVINDVDMTFVVGAHMGCRSICIFSGSEIRTAEDSKRKTITIHDGIGNSSQSIIYHMLDGEGTGPTFKAEYLDTAGSAVSAAAMESGEAGASIFSGCFIVANHRDKIHRVRSITSSDEFRGEVCYIAAMGNDFPVKNPVRARHTVMATKRAGQFARLHSEGTMQLIFDTNKMTDEFKNQFELWDSLDFGLSDAITGEMLGNITTDYIYLGVIQKREMTADNVIKLAWANVCPDAETPGLIMGGPKDMDGHTVEVQQKGEQIGDR